MEELEMAPGRSRWFKIWHALSPRITVILAVAVSLSTGALAQRPPVDPRANPVFRRYDGSEAAERIIALRTEIGTKNRVGLGVAGVDKSKELEHIK
jgi:hypothetical protein